MIFRGGECIIHKYSSFETFVITLREAQQVRLHSKVTFLFLPFFSLFIVLSCKSKDICEIGSTGTLSPINAGRVKPV
ncbi:hypothetical protein BDV41DRAFT_549849 [Aspergillus transmontanensis]|uniref:Uncharacterized protein n=1 Tax=Aspergillus transmontanensis TaxID=1034304 RepID=A0A5N6VPF7_9EURO|nr:hypothetical protein BDV41DRAFT_549849 [Aspergillus transmontanensis]